MDKFESRPTEYKGVKYRSKSEAMFARFMELDIETVVHMHSVNGPFFQGELNAGQGGFVYEPAALKVGRWVPDFLRWSHSGDFVNDFGIPELSYSIIEYKPSKPTATYVEEFVQRIKELVGRIAATENGKLITEKLRGEVYYGSIWTKERGVIEVSQYPKKGPDGWYLEWDAWDTDSDWLVNYEDEVKATRFDLREGSYL